MTYDYNRQIQSLLDLDLTEREAKVYLTLLSRKSFSTSDLQHSAKIPRTKIYEVLQKLIDRGICIESKSGKKKYYEAVEPAVAFNKVLDRYHNQFENEYEKKKNLAGNLINILTPLFNENKELLNPLDFIEIIKDKDQIQKNYIKELQNTNEELLTFNKGPYACDNPSRLNEQKAEEAKLLKRGGICRNIYEYFELSRQEWLIQYVKDQIKLGQQARVIELLPIKMLIFDNKTVMFPLKQPIGRSKTLTVIWIEHSELAFTCKILFNYLWEKSKPFEEVVSKFHKVHKD